MSANQPVQASLPTRGFITGHNTGTNPSPNYRGRGGQGGRGRGNNRGHNRPSSKIRPGCIVVRPIDGDDLTFPELHFPMPIKAPSSFSPWQEVSFNLNPEAKRTHTTIFGKSVLSVKPDDLVELHNDEDNPFIQADPWIPGVITQINPKPRNNADIGGRIKADWLLEGWAPRPFFLHKLTDSDDPATFRIGDHVKFSTYSRLEEDSEKPGVFSRYTDIYKVRIDDDWLETNIKTNTNPRLQEHMMKSFLFDINVEIGGNSRTSSPDIPLVDARTCRTTFAGPHPTYPQVVKSLQNKMIADKAKGDYETNPTTKLFLDIAKVALKPGGKQGKKKLHPL